MKRWMTIAATMAMISFFAMPATAANWNFYGSARIATFVVDKDKATGEDTKDYEYALQTNSRIGARVKSDDIRGRFEFGNEDGNITVRHLYGEWRFDGGSLLVGQTNTPYNMFTSNQVYGEGADGGDTQLLKWGGVYDGREAMVQLKLGNFKIAIIEPKTDDLNIDPDDAIMEAKIPKIEVSYRFKFDNARLDIAALYNTYDLTDDSTNITYDVDSYLLAVGGRIDLGPVRLSGNVWGGQNPGTSGIWTSNVSTPRIVDDQLVDNDGYGYTLVTAYTLSDMFRFEAGYGYSAAERDHENYEKDAEAAYYLQSRITMAKGVYIIPEIGVVDEKKSVSGKQQTETLYYGIQWKIDF